MSPKLEAIEALADAIARTDEETDHRLLVYCYQVLTGQAQMTSLHGQVLAYAKAAANESQYSRRYAAYLVLDRQDAEARRMLEICEDAPGFPG